MRAVSMLQAKREKRHDESTAQATRSRPAPRGSLMMGVAGVFLLAITLLVIGALPGTVWAAPRVLVAGFVSCALVWKLLAARRPNPWTGALAGLAAMPCGLWLNWYLFLFDLWFRNEYQVNPAGRIDASLLGPVANLGQALDYTAMSLTYPGFACLPLFIAAGALLGWWMSRQAAANTAGPAR